MDFATSLNDLPSVIAENVLKTNTTRRFEMMTSGAGNVVDLDRVSTGPH
jgi:hypothetical protein